MSTERDTRGDADRAREAAEALADLERRGHDEPLDLGPAPPSAGAAGEGQDLTARAAQAVEETTRCVRRYASGAVVATFAGGVLGGWLVGRIVARGSKTRRPARGTEGPPQPGAGKGYREAVLNWEDEGGRGAPEERQTQ